MLDLLVLCCLFVCCWSDLFLPLFFCLQVSRRSVYRPVSSVRARVLDCSVECGCVRRHSFRILVSLLRITSTRDLYALHRMAASVRSEHGQHQHTHRHSHVRSAWLSVNISSWTWISGGLALISSHSSHRRVLLFVLLYWRCYCGLSSSVESSFLPCECGSENISRRHRSMQLSGVGEMVGAQT